MNQRIQNYLAKRANLERHEIVCPDPPRNLETVIVIPALAEEATLPVTLESLTHCNPERLEETLIIVVINNGPRNDTNGQFIDENQRTLKLLQSDQHPGLHLAYIDASSPGFELSKKEGVGSARKIGMDHAANLLLQANSTYPLIVCLDADTIVRQTYLDALRAFARSENPWGSVINYAHSMPDDPTEKAAIISYELFLRYHVLGLRYARSPYEFHTIGSTIACTPEAYAAVSGMNRRKAGEDFYFLQQLAKTGSVTPIVSSIVVPSPRISWRVPFGTGKRIGRFVANTHPEYTVYHPRSYEILKDWIDLVSNNLDSTGEHLLRESQQIHPELRTFLENFEFNSKWSKLKANATNPEQTLSQFHCLFDAFQTLKLFHHLRDTALPDQNTFTAYGQMLDKLYINLFINPDVQENVSEQYQFLNAIRKVMGNSDV